MLAKVRRWGNGLALRVHKRDLESPGVAEGDVVQVELIRSPEGGQLDSKAAPTIADEDKRASERHDRYLKTRAAAGRRQQLPRSAPLAVPPVTQYARRARRSRRA